MRGGLRPEVDVCGLDGVKQQLGHSGPLHVDQVRLEQSLRGPEAFSTHLHLPPVRQLQHTQETGEFYFVRKTTWLPSDTILSFIQTVGVRILLIVTLKKQFDIWGNTE